LKTVTIYGKSVTLGESVTLGGIEGFVRRARELQERGVMTRAFEIRATGCDWEHGELERTQSFATSQTYGLRFALILAY
jgi:hypothetical protein